MYQRYIIHFLSNGAVASVDYIKTDISYPIFYGGYMGINSANFNNTIKIEILYNNGSKLEIFQEASEDFQGFQINNRSKSSYVHVLQKQNMIAYIREYDNIFWSIDYYPLNSIGSNGKIIYYIKLYKIIIFILIFL